MQFWIAKVVFIFSYVSDTRTSRKSELEPLLLVKWLHRITDIRQCDTFLPLHLYIPFKENSSVSYSDFSVVSVASVYCPCFVARVPGEPSTGVWAGRYKKSVSGVLFLNLSISMGQEYFAKRVIELHRQRYPFSPGVP